MRRVTSIFFVIFCLTTVKSQILPTKAELINKIKQVNEFWILVNPDPGNNEWARATYFIGNTDLYKVYPKKQYVDYSNLWAEKHEWSLSGGQWTRNADNQCAGQTYIDLYLMDEEPMDYKLTQIDGCIGNMMSLDKIDDWWWIDALYMGMPIFARLGVLHSDATYFNRMYAMYSDTKVGRGLYNSEEGLWYRDGSFKPPYTTPNGEDSYWARGNGWVFGAHARVLQQLPDTNQNRAEYIETFQKMAAALKERQRSDGFWNVSLNDPDDFGGPETSGTSFFTYGMAWGINNGFLDSATYYPIVVKAWEGLTKIAVHENGFLGYCQGVGIGPSSSQPVTYNSIADFGVGAFILAGSELVKLAQGEMPQPPTFYIDSVKITDENTIVVYFNETLDEDSALNTENYYVQEHLVSYVRLSADKKSVTLTVSELTPGYIFLLIDNIYNTTGIKIERVSKYLQYFGETTVTASSYQLGTDNVPKNTLDFNFGTRWSAEGLGEWLLFDLGKVQVVSSVDIAFYNGNQRVSYFDVSLSIDGDQYISVVDTQSCGTSWDLENFGFQDQKARYVLITGYGNSESEWNSITEVRINLRPKDTKLSELQIDTGELEPSFNSDTLFYSVLLPVGTDSVNISAIVGDTMSTVSDNGQIHINASDTTVKIEVTAWDEKTTSTYTIDFELEKEEEESGIQTSGQECNNLIYPNPFHSNFSLLLNGVYRYSIYDVVGRLILNQKAENETIVGDNLTPGLYYLKVEQNKALQTMPLIKL